VAYPGRVFKGVADWVSETLDPATRTAKVRCKLDNADRALKPEMYATAALAVAMAIAAAAGARSWFEGAAALWLALAGAYLAAILAASFGAARRGGWATLPYLPAAFATFHISYGLGFAAGLLRFSDVAFTRISR